MDVMMEEQTIDSALDRLDRAIFKEFLHLEYFGPKEDYLNSIQTLRRIAEDCYGASRTFRGDLRLKSEKNGDGYSRFAVLHFGNRKDKMRFLREYKGFFRLLSKATVETIATE